MPQSIVKCLFLQVEPAMFGQYVIHFVYGGLSPFARIPCE